MKLFKEIIFKVYCIIFLLCLPIFLAFQEKYEMAALVAVISLVFLLVINLENIEILKVWGLEAKLREKLNEATATAAQLKAIAKTISKSMLTDMMAGNFMSGIKLVERHNLYKEIIQSLEGIGLSQNEINDVKSNWDKGVALIYDRGISARIFGTGRTVNEALFKARREQHEEYRAMQNFATWQAVTPVQIETFMNAHQFPIDEEVAELLNDYKEFLKTKKISNENRFVEL